MMRAAIYERYGPPNVVQVKNIPKPSPKADEILVRVHRASVTAADWRIRTLDVPRGFKTMSRLFFGVFAPRQPVLGTELSGTVEAVGTKVENFVLGQRVLAHVGAKLGCHAEYRVLSQNDPIVALPDCIDDDVAATLSFGGNTALCFLRDQAKLKAGEKILIIGASGAVGSAAVQLAKHFGAQVTGVCSAKNVEFVTKMGADTVIDYQSENFLKKGQHWDVIFDTVGASSFSDCQHVLAPSGKMLLGVAGLSELLTIPFRTLGSDKKILSSPVGEKVEDLRYLCDLVEKGHYRPWIERRYPLSNIAQAHAHVESQRKRGNIVIDMLAK